MSCPGPFLNAQSRSHTWVTGYHHARSHARLHPGVRLLQKTFHNAIKFIMLLFTLHDELGCPSGLRGQTQVFFSGLRRNIVRKSVLVVTDCVGSNPTLSTVFLLPWGTYMYDCSLPLCRSITLGREQSSNLAKLANIGLQHISPL